MLTVMLGGGPASLGSVIDTAGARSAPSSGSSRAFTVLAGVIVAGVGTAWRSVVGVLFIAVIGSGFGLRGLDPLFAQLCLGGLLSLAVGLDAWTPAQASERTRDRRW